MLGEVGETGIASTVSERHGDYRYDGTVVLVNFETRVSFFAVIRVDTGM